MLHVTMSQSYIVCCSANLYCYVILYVTLPQFMLCVTVCVIVYTLTVCVIIGCATVCASYWSSAAQSTSMVT